MNVIPKLGFTIRRTFDVSEENTFYYQRIHDVIRCNNEYC